MFGWSAREAYRKDVLAVVADIVVDADGRMIPAMLRQYPGIEDTIRSSFDNKVIKDETGVLISLVFLSDMLDRMEDRARRGVVARAIRAWATADANVVAAFRADAAAGRVDRNLDVLDLRLRLALSTVMNMAQTGRVAVDTFERFAGELVGALDGVSRDERDRRRLIDAVQDALAPKLKASDDDTSAVMPPSYEPSEPADFSGTLVEVTVVPTPSGLALRRKDDGEIITERRTLTQDTLASLPNDAERYRFANLRARSGEIYSCVVVEPGSKVFGDMRAFWWALACSIVETTAARANVTQLTQEAFVVVYGNARGMWDSAIQQQPIENMRDLIMPLRNIHFEVITGLIDKAQSEAEKLGVKIALAMVMAVQSEDERLERYAYRRLKRFLWRKGEEPREFWGHEQA
jgi:hypothetical protein